MPRFSFIIFFCLLLQNATSLLSRDYDASFFGIESNGIKLNTRAIQKAIDHISAEGGGRLIFHVGRYLSGSIYLKSNVTLVLKEGAELWGSLDPFDYDRNEDWTALIFAFDQENIGIVGKGVINGRGYPLVQKMIDHIHKGLIVDDRFENDRPYAKIRPQNIFFKGCKNILIEGIQINNPASWNQQYELCSKLTIRNISVDAKNYWNNDGMDIVDCDSVIVADNYIDASDDGICLKSHHRKVGCSNVLIQNNTIRSSASAIKFGTYTFGGCRNINILNNKVYNTYRSALTFAAMDGCTVENILVDGLEVENTGNVFFFRIGARYPERHSIMRNILVKNVRAVVAANKPDVGYAYEGPIEDLPRNISPIVLSGFEEDKIENIAFEDIDVLFPGGADRYYANVPLDSISSIPELGSKYPEYSMFKELPAWAVFARHLKNLSLKNIRFNLEKPDFRKAIVVDDIDGLILKDVFIQQAGKKTPRAISAKSACIHFEASTNIQLN